MPYPSRGDVRPSRCLHTTLERVSSGLAVFLINHEAPGAYARDAHRYSFPSLKRGIAVAFNTPLLYHRERDICRVQPLSLLDNQQTIRGLYFLCSLLKEPRMSETHDEKYGLLVQDFRHGMCSHNNSWVLCLCACNSGLSRPTF